MEYNYVKVDDDSDEVRINEYNEYNESFQTLLKDEKLNKTPAFDYGNCLGPDKILEKLKMNDITGRD